MTVENISSSISTKECCKPRRWLNSRPPGFQSNEYPTEPPRPAVWLDNEKNLRWYILRYTVGNPTSSHDASHWLAFGFTQLTALVALCKYYIFSIEKMNKCIWMEITAFNGKVCDGIFCDILSEIWHHHITSLLIGWHLVLRSSQHLSLCANRTFFNRKMNTCIRMRITAFKLVICLGKSEVLRLQITFYGSADASP